MSQLFQYPTRRDTVRPRSLNPFYIVSYRHKMGQDFLDIQQKTTKITLGKQQQQYKEYSERITINLNSKNSLKDDSGAARQHLEGALGDHVLEVFERELHLLHQTICAPSCAQVPGQIVCGPRLLCQLDKVLLAGSDPLVRRGGAVLGVLQRVQEVLLE